MGACTDALIGTCGVTDSLPGTELKVVIFDVDGTLYRQGPLRRAMLLRLLRTYATRPLSGWRTFRTLSAYRQAQEDLRTEAAEDVASAQIRAACERTGLDRSSVAATVERWMEREPLDLLPACLCAGLTDFLRTCTARGLRLAALSDYPAEAKLDALGLADFFDVVLCAQAPEIGVFKPHPRGLEVALERMGASRHECLYVGDRAEVDAAAAAAAGIPSVILSRHTAASSDRHRTVTGYPQLQELLFGSCHVAMGGVISAES
jgi:HAD superfamily hydrolase (TIGR01509 family)